MAKKKATEIAAEENAEISSNKPGAPLGNRFWEMRSKHGRDKLFSSADLLWEAACEYFQWCEDNPWYKIDFKGKDAEEVKIPTARPFTIQGLCRFLDCSSSYFREFKRSPPKDSKDFLTVITRIEETIYQHKFEGAVVGAFNANIISRDLGLADKQHIENSDSTVTVRIGGRRIDGNND